MTLDEAKASARRMIRPDISVGNILTVDHHGRDARRRLVDDERDAGGARPAHRGDARRAAAVQARDLGGDHKAARSAARADDGGVQHAVGRAAPGGRGGAYAAGDREGAGVRGIRKPFNLPAYERASRL
jgi:hypothetical protein